MAKSKNESRLMENYNIVIACNITNNSINIMSLVLSSLDQLVEYVGKCKRLRLLSRNKLSTTRLLGCLNIWKFTSYQ